MSRVLMRRCRAFTLLAFAILWMAIGASTANAQKTTLTITGFPIAFPSPTGADFYAGSVQAAGSVTYTVNATTGTTGQRTTTVSIRCNAPCPTSGPQTVTTLQWRRADLGTWNTLTTTNVTVETRPVFRNSTNDPWSNSMFWRFNLDWATDGPGAATSFRIFYTLTVTVP